jgi:MFS superfamily sulfate permease-like transporter
VLGGMALAVILNAKNLSQKFHIEKVENQDKTVYQVNGALYFLTANKLFDFIVKELENVNEITLDLTKLDRVDFSTVDKLEKLIVEVKDQGKTLEVLASSDIINKRLDKYLK